MMIMKASICVNRLSNVNRCIASTAIVDLTPTQAREATDAGHWQQARNLLVPILIDDFDNVEVQYTSKMPCRTSIKLLHPISMMCCMKCAVYGRPTMQ